MTNFAVDVSFKKQILWIEWTEQIAPGKSECSIQSNATECNIKNVEYFPTANE